MSHKAHHAEAEKYTKIRCAVLTISDTRTEDTDRSGGLMRVRLEKAGHYPGLQTLTKLAETYDTTIPNLIETIRA